MALVLHSASASRTVIAIGILLRFLLRRCAVTTMWPAVVGAFFALVAGPVPVVGVAVVVWALAARGRPDASHR